MDERRLEIKVGAFLLLGIAGVFGLLLLMGEIDLSGDAKLEVHFAHTGNVVRGAPVKLGGVAIGRVERIVLDADRRDEAGAPLPVSMGLAIRPEVRRTLHADAAVTVATVGPLGEPYLELYPGSAAAPPLPEGVALRGTDAPRLDLIALQLSSFFESAGNLLEDHPEALGELVTGVSGLAKNADAMLVENRDDVRALATELTAAARDLRALSALARRQLEPGGRGDRLLSDTAATTRALRTDLPQLTGDARKVLGQLSTLSSQFTEEDVQKLRAAIDRYGAAGEKLESLATRGDRLLMQLESGEGTLGQLQNDPTLYRDLKALVEDLRKHPWKILWKD